MEGLTEKRNLKTDLKEVRDGAIWCQEEHFRKCSMARVKQRNTQEHRGQHGARGMTERQRSRGDGVGQWGGGCWDLTGHYGDFSFFPKKSSEGLRKRRGIWLRCQ